MHSRRSWRAAGRVSHLTQLTMQFSGTGALVSLFYKCRYDEGLLLVPESLLGGQAEAEHILASITAARDTALAPILLAGLPHKATEVPTRTVPATLNHSNVQQHQAVPPAAAGPEGAQLASALLQEPWTALKESQRRR